jgi:hypothetical protein
MTTQATDGAITSLTRLEVAEAVGDAFGLRSVNRDALLQTAERAGARPEVLAVLHRLPAREFSDLRQLWSELPDMPVR